MRSVSSSPTSADWCSSRRSSICPNAHQGPERPRLRPRSIARDATGGWRTRWPSGIGRARRVVVRATYRSVCSAVRLRLECTRDHRTSRTAESPHQGPTQSPCRIPTARSHHASNGRKTSRGGAESRPSHHQRPNIGPVIASYADPIGTKREQSLTVSGSAHPLCL